MWMRRCISSPSSLKLLLASGTATSPATMACTRNGVKVSLTPCRSNSPLSRSRARTTCVMSASITVVTWGEVCTLSSHVLGDAAADGGEGDEFTVARFARPAGSWKLEAGCWKLVAGNWMGQPDSSVGLNRSPVPGRSQGGRSAVSGADGGRSRPRGTGAAT